ncbi:MAG TPA: endonuclease/exonuclease/phosphatase family protein [Anaerolineales bacterium]|jgi:endonuclease/exonuclease/phosphatase family metal-dependent hydrolase
MQARTQTPIALHRLQMMALMAIITAFGLQLLRVLLPSLVWYLKETQQAATTTLGGLAALTAIAGLLAIPLWRFLGQRTSLWTVGAAVLVARLLEQLSRDPALDTWLSLLGTAAFTVFLPLWLGHVRAAPSLEGGPRWAGGLLLGLTLDSALKGLANSLDLSWIGGWLPLLPLALLAGWSLWLLRSETYAAGMPASDARLVNVLPLLGLGPYLVLQAIVFQNSGWVAATAGVDGRIGIWLVMAGNLAALAGMVGGFSKPGTFRPGLGLIAGLYLTLSATQLQVPGPGFIAILLAAQFVCGWVWATISLTAAQTERGGLGRTSALLSLAMFLFIGLAFFYYAALDLRLPFDRSIVFPAAGLVFGLAALWASRQGERVPRSPQLDWSPIHAGLFLSLLPAIWLSVQAFSSPARTLQRTPERVLSYNIHSAYDITGRQDPEAIAQVIESSGADIVGLQEISRGWLINGSTDLVHWLSQRLGMRVVFQGTSDPVWGNAILSRLPIQQWGMAPLPRGDALLGRGYLWAEFADAYGGELLFITTHLHQTDDGAELRRQQATGLVEFWGERQPAILVGDLNAEPPEPAIGVLLEAGLADAWSAAGQGDGLTYPAGTPDRRIDWILLTPDLAAVVTEVIGTTASDHRPLFVRFEHSP